MKSQLYRCGEKTITVTAAGESADCFIINDENGDPYIPDKDWSFKQAKQTLVDVEGIRYTMTDRGLEQI